MKRLTLFLLAGLFLLASCQHNGLRTETLKIDEEIPLRDGSEFALGLNVNVEFPVSGFDAAALDMVRRAIRTRTLGDAFAENNGPLDALAKDFRDMWANDYHTSNEEILKAIDAGEDFGGNLSWETEITGRFGEEYRNWINYYIEEYLYEGGAHGMNMTAPMVFDRRTGLPLSDQEFTQRVSRDQLLELIDRHKFDAMEGLPAVDRENIYYVDRIEPSHYFSVGEDGLTYYYQPYDVAPYVFGVITITIPWNELDFS